MHTVRYRLNLHQSLRVIGFAVEDRTGFPQYPNYRCILCSNSPYPGNISGRSIFPFDVEMVLDRKWQPVPRPDRFASLRIDFVQIFRPLKTLFEENMGEAIKLYAGEQILTLDVDYVVHTTCCARAARLQKASVKS